MRRNVGRKPQTSANLAAFLHIIDTSRLLRILKSDSSAIIKAASKAEQAFNYLRDLARPASHASGDAKVEWHEPEALAA